VSDDDDAKEEGRVLAVHIGHSANCSSIGSVIDLLFLSSTAAAALVSAITLIVVHERKRDE
jgi:hypothetical protein